MKVMTLRFALAISLVVALGGVRAPLRAATANPDAVMPERIFDPVAFFTGATVGNGSLKKVFSSPKASHVAGFGRLRRDGRLALDQTVTIAGEPVKTRQWLLRQTGPGQFAGTLSDASGPVEAQVSGSLLMIHYTMDGGMAVDQVLTIAEDGQSARNVMKIRKFGLVVATLNETIHRK